MPKAIHFLIVYTSRFFPPPRLPASSTFSLMCSRDLLWRWQRRDIKQTIPLAVQTPAENNLFAFVCLPHRLFPIRNVPDMIFFSSFFLLGVGLRARRLPACLKSDASEGLLDETWQIRTTGREKEEAQRFGVRFSFHPFIKL